MSNVPNIVLFIVENSSLNFTFRPMESDSEDRLEPELRINLLLEIAQKPSLERDHGDAEALPSHASRRRPRADMAYGQVGQLPSRRGRSGQSAAWRRGEFRPTRSRQGSLRPDTGGRRPGRQDRADGEAGCAEGPRSRPGGAVAHRLAKGRAHPRLQRRADRVQGRGARRHRGVQPAQHSGGRRRPGAGSSPTMWPARSRTRGHSRRYSG